MNIDDLAPRIFEEAHDNALPRTFLSRPVPSKRRGGGGRIFQGPGSLVMDLASENFDLKDSQNFLT